MESFVTPIISSILSASVVGLVLTVFKIKLDQNIEVTKEANALKFKAVTDKMDAVSSRLGGVEGKVDTILKDMHVLDNKLAVLTTEQTHTTQNISNLRSTLETFGKENFGKVILK